LALARLIERLNTAGMTIATNFCVAAANMPETTIESLVAGVRMRECLGQPRQGGIRDAEAWMVEPFETSVL
jgi:hypothetical protein